MNTETLDSEQRAGDLMKTMMRQFKTCQIEQQDYSLKGKMALTNLVEACRKHRSDQTYRLRNLLYSLFNGQLENLNDVQTLDWALRVDVSTVIAAIGCPGFPDYAIREAFEAAGLLAWFIDASREGHAV